MQKFGDPMPKKSQMISRTIDWQAVNQSSIHKTTRSISLLKLSRRAFGSFDKVRGGFLRPGHTHDPFFYRKVTRATSFGVRENQSRGRRLRIS
jgi:hypothetical protein